MINSTQSQQIENAIISADIDAWLALMTWIDSQESQKEELFAYFSKALEQWVNSKMSYLIDALFTTDESKRRQIIDQLKCLSRIRYDVRRFQEML